MPSDSQASSSPKWMLWAGWVLSVLPAFMMLMSAYGKFTNSEQLVQGFEHLGWPLAVATTLGILELGSAIIYLIPQTAVLGAILLTGYLGGAVATHIRVGENLMSLAPAGFGVVLWLGLFLRDARIRQLLPIRR